MNIYQKINAVMKKADYLKKDSHVQNYMAVTHDAVTSLLRQHMIDVGIVMTVTQHHGHLDDAIGDAKMRLYHGTYYISFINADDPQDSFTICVQSQAFDNGDKAPGKAISYATKMGLLKTFMIETGVDDESRAYDPGVEQITAVEYEKLQSALKKSGRTEDAVMKFLKTKNATFDTLAEMNQGFYQFTMTMLKKVSKNENN